MITKNQVDALIASKFDLFETNEYLKTEREKILSAIREEIESLIELALPEICQERCNHFNLDGTTPEDYSEKILKLDEEKFILAGIRFQGLDVTKPFIGIQLSDSNIDELTIFQVMEVVKKEFSVFAPLAIQIKLPRGLPIINA